MSLATLAAASRQGVGNSQALRFPGSVKLARCLDAEQQHNQDTAQKLELLH
eukprot:m.233030 g.233030  ORF g.233030 m.233030 type:complete len:51 (+) comp22453_c1_seq1:464-616(+)